MPPKKCYKVVSEKCTHSLYLSPLPFVQFAYNPHDQIYGNKRIKESALFSAEKTVVVCIMFYFRSNYLFIKFVAWLYTKWFHSTEQDCH